MRARSSFWAQLGPGTFEGAQPLVQQIRAAMLQLLHTHGDPALAAALQRDLEAAPDLAALWYLRPRLLQVFSGVSDSAAAEAAMHEITQMFAGHFGNAISSRFGPQRK